MATAVQSLSRNQGSMGFVRLDLRLMLLGRHLVDDGVVVGWMVVDVVD